MIIFEDQSYIVILIKLEKKNFWKTKKKKKKEVRTKRKSFILIKNNNYVVLFLRTKTNLVLYKQKINTVIIIQIL